MDISKISFNRLTYYRFSVIAILILAFILRFYNYNNRWGLAYDQAHDALVARYALEAKKIPLVGPFSSAGPFQTGGEWYWLIMAATSIYPNSVLTPWIILTLSNILFVYLMAALGKELLGKKFGLALGLLSAVSSAQISQSINLTNQAPIPLLSLFAIWAAFAYLKKKKAKYLFFLTFSVSLAATIHLQGAALFLLILITLLFSGLPDKKGIIYSIIGLFIPLVPLLIFDLQNNFVNINGFLRFYLIEQRKISYDVLGRRWLTYIFNFWPKAWANIIGGNDIIGYLIPLFLGIFIVYGLLKKKISVEWKLILISLGLMVIILRYIKTPLFDSYLMFVNPLVLLLTAWVLYKIFNWRIWVGLTLFLLVISGSLYRDIKDINYSTNSTAQQANKWKKVLTKNLLDKKFAVYDYKYRQVGRSLPLVLFLAADGKIDDNGFKIGIAESTAKTGFEHFLLNSENNYSLYNLNSSVSGELLDAGWIFVNPSSVYSATADWHKIN